MSFKIAEVTKEEHDELVCSYAALILNDAGKEITADAIGALVSSSGNTVEPYWGTLFAKLMSTFTVEEMLLSGGAGGGGGGGGGAGGAAEEEEEE